jgi:hypothetical protein
MSHRSESIAFDPLAVTVDKKASGSLNVLLPRGFDKPPEVQTTAPAANRDERDGSCCSEKAAARTMQLHL